jgi:alginate O-acetyltransferase complex protein AlgI
VLTALACAILLTPLYWVALPSRCRVPAVTAASFAVLCAYDLRLALLLGLSVAALAWLSGVQSWPKGRRMSAQAGGITVLILLFAWNKLQGSDLAVVPSQGGGVALLGVSYLVLKAAAFLLDSARGSLRDARPAQIAAWLCFLPTYPSGPMEEFDHFRRQQPLFDWANVAGGLERILFGLAKAVVASQLLAEFADPIFADPAGASRVDRLLATYAVTLRFYFDFAGYSDLAIGLAALYGFDIEENFDNPLIRRNLVQLWRRWHMSLTRFLRVYLFLPVSRRLLRRSDAAGGLLAIAAGQLAAMLFCGLWHGLAWNFAVWGGLQALGLIWVGVGARELGRRLPSPLVSWWRSSPVAYVLSSLMTFHVFAAINVFIATDVGSAAGYLLLLVAG